MHHPPIPYHQLPQWLPADEFKPGLSSKCMGHSWQQDVCPQSTRSPVPDMARDANTNNATGYGCREVMETGGCAETF